LPDLEDANLEGVGKEVDVRFVRFPGDSLSTIFLRLHTKESHKTMFIEDISFIIDGEKVSVVKNKSLTFTYYQSIGVKNGLTPEIKKINASSYFKKMKQGDEKEFAIIMRYSFDDKNIETYEARKKIKYYWDTNGFAVFIEKIIPH
jgi:hypothetical protein